MRMILNMDPNRGRQLADLLFHKFLNEGIHGRTDMPEDEPPEGVTRGSLEHLCFITFTVAIDYMRDAPTLWNNSRLTFSDPETKYLFYPKKLEQTSFDKVLKDMQKHSLSKKPDRDANIWLTIGTTFSRKWGGDPLNFIERCNWDTIKILEHLNKDKHDSKGKDLSDFPNLRGPKIGPLWIRMLRDNVGLTKLINLDKVPMPIDIHIARATMTTGVLRGHYRGDLTKLFPEIRLVWSDSIKGLSIKGRPMIVLDIDEPLWHLSKYGCSGNRNKQTGLCSVHNRCEAKDFCIQGKVSVENKLVEIDT
jgi:hypothetical protein